VIRGIDPAAEAKVAEVGKHMRSGVSNALKPGEFGIVLGSELCTGAYRSGRETVVSLRRKGRSLRRHHCPRLRQSGWSAYSNRHVRIRLRPRIHSLQDAQRLYRLTDAVSGVRLRLNDLLRAPQVAARLARDLPGESMPRTGPAAMANFFRAVENREAGDVHHPHANCGGAAFNIVSALVMAVTDKQADIGHLRTLGAAPGSVMRIFMVQGALMVSSERSSAWQPVWCSR